MGNASFEWCEYCKGQRCNFKYTRIIQNCIRHAEVAFGALNILEHNRVNLDNHNRDIQVFYKIYIKETAGLGNMFRH